MTYKKMFEQDSEYQAIINKFKAEKNELIRKANYGTYKKEYLIEVGSNISNELFNAVKDYYQKRLNETKEAIKRLENQQKDVGYTARLNEAKEFEMRYKLADDYELKNMVEDLKSDDLLEINLLRMELKNRGMDDLDKQVKHYVIRNQINGMNEVERKEYEEHNAKLATYNTLGSNAVVIDGELQTLSNINKELFSIALTTDAE